MTQFFYFIILTIISLQSFAQYPLDYKRDNQWRIGVRYYPGSTWGNSMLDFTQLPVAIDTMTNHVPLKMTNANICDTSGQLLFTANGCFIYNREGDKVDPTQLACEDLCTSYLQTGHTIPQINLFLPQPGNDSVVYLFHNSQNIINVDNVSIYDDTIYNPLSRLFGTLFVSKINQKANGGLGGIMSMNEQVSVKDSITFNLLSACRHANGRDWWIMVPTVDDNLYYTYLLSPSGLELKLSQRVGNKVYQGVGYACFSPDGTKYARADGVSFLLPYYYNVYDFDRCTGRLTNPVLIRHAIHSVGWLPSVAFSTSSRFMYLGACDRIYQYDMEATNWLDTKIMVDSFDGFKMFVLPNDSFPIAFDNMQLAPDGKIYIASGQNIQTPYLHIIHAPDSAGVACNVEQRAITLLKQTASNLPSNPNHRLGPVDGSGCDTLGIDNIVVSVEDSAPFGSAPFGSAQGAGVRVYPNPAGSVVNVELQGSCKACLATTLTFGLYDIQGREVLREKAGPGKTQIYVGNLVKGMYIWEVETDNGFFYGKLMLE